MFRPHPLRTVMDEQPASIRLYLASGPDDLVVERPLVLRCGDLELITLCTPGLEEEWALGFLRGENVIASAADVASVVYVPGSGEIADTVTVHLRDAAAQAGVVRLRRAHEIRASCGACGSASVDELLSGMPAFPAGAPELNQKSLSVALASLRAHQEVFSLTGGCHAALLFDPQSGATLAHAEDVGRHNAVDKALGLALRSGVDFSRAALLLSGRSGYDLAIKSLRAGIPILVSVGASTSFAHDLSSRAGATLLAFAKPSGARVLCDAGRAGGIVQG